MSALMLAIEGTPSLEVVRAISDGADYVWTKELGEAFRRVQTKTLDLFQMMGLNRIVLSQLVLILQKHHSQPQDREDIRAFLLSGQVKRVLQEMPSLRVEGEGEGISVCRSKSDSSGLQKPCSPMQAQTTPHDEANTNGDGHDDPSTSSGIVVTTTTSFEGATLEAITAQCCAFPGAKLSELRLKVPEVLALFNGADELSALRLAIEGTPSLEVMQASGDGEHYVWTKDLGEAFRRVEAKIVQLFDKIGLQRILLSQLMPQLKKHYPQPQVRDDVRNILLSGEKKLKWVIQKMPLLQVDGEEGQTSVSRASNGSSGSGNGDTSINTQVPRALACLRRLMHEFKYRETKWPATKVALQEHIQGAFVSQELMVIFPDFASSDPRKVAKHASKKLMTFIAATGIAQKHKGNELKWNVRKALSVLGDGSVPSPRSAAPPAASTVLTTSLTATGTTRWAPPQPPPAPARVPTAAHHVAAHQTPAVVLVDSLPELERAASEITAAVSSAMTVDEHGTDPLNQQDPDERDPAAILAVDCEGVPNELILVQVAVPGGPAFVFDCLVLGPQAVCAALAAILADRAVPKLFHDLHMDAAAIAAVGGIRELNGTLDTQLVVESLTGELHIGMNKMLQFFGSPEHPGKAAMKRRMQQQQQNSISGGGGSGGIFLQRPLPQDVLMYAAQDVSLLVEARGAILEALGNSNSNLEGLRRASDKRAAVAMESGGLRQVAFDLSGGGCRFASRELLEELRPEDMCRSRALEVSDDSEVLLSLLPDAMAEHLRELPGGSRGLSDICLDKGRRPYAWVDGRRVFLLDDDANDDDSEGPNSSSSSSSSKVVVEPRDIEAVVEKLGGFGSDDRAGLEQQLHRVSGMRNRDGNVIGLTMRVGASRRRQRRHDRGPAALRRGVPGRGQHPHPGAARVREDHDRAVHRQHDVGALQRVHHRHEQ